MKKFTNLTEFKGQLKEGNKIEIIIHTLLSDGKTNDERCHGIISDINELGFSISMNAKSIKTDFVVWFSTPEVNWCGTYELMKSTKNFCSVYNNTILFKSTNLPITGCYTFALHPDVASCCPKCKGSGMSFTTIQDWGKPEQEISIGKCYDCKGEPVDEIHGQRIADNNAAIEAMWCKCENTDSYYVDDTSSMKHHWRCRKCRKITQIG
jgi:hypothetical protein